MSVKFWFVNCAFMCLFGFGAAYASNSSFRPILDPAIHIEQQETKTCDDQVIVSNVIINSSEHNITQLFLTPPNTIITANNIPAEILNIQAAISEQNLDVTRILKNLGVPLDPITAMHVIDSSPNREHIRTKLIEAKLIDKDREAPLWTVSSYSYWRQMFPAQSSTTIKQSSKLNSSDQQKNIDKQKISDKQNQKTESKSLLSMPWFAMKKIYNAALFWRSSDNATIVSVDQDM